MDCRCLIFRKGWAGMATLMLCTGCVYFRGPSPPSAPTSLAIPAAATTTKSATGNNSGRGNVGVAAPADTAAILAEVQQLGTVDPAAQNALLEDMKKTDPSLWPQLVQTFRASVAFHKEAAERDRLAALQANLNQSVASVPVANTLNQNNLAMQTAPLQAGRYVGVNGALFETPKSLPDSMDIALAPKSPPAEFVASYPNTQMPEVHLCAAEQSVATDWHDQLGAAIKTLESGTTTSDGPQAPQSPAQQATLRMLYLAAGRRDDALRPAAGPATADQEFWNEELFGLVTALDEKHLPDASQRAAEATKHLGYAVAKLGQSAPLVVRNLAFCTEVLSYGIYKPFAKYEFKPGQETVLYAEVENFISQPTDRGYHTALRSRYEVLDSRGVRVAEQQYAATEEWCKNPRRDYFVRYFLYMPGRVSSGNYTLQLTIEDTLGNKVAQSSIPFTIAGEN